MCGHHIRRKTTCHAWSRRSRRWSRVVNMTTGGRMLIHGTASWHLAQLRQRRWDQSRAHSGRMLPKTAKLWRERVPKRAQWRGRPVGTASAGQALALRLALSMTGLLASSCTNETGRFLWCGHLRSGGGCGSYSNRVDCSSGGHRLRVLWIARLLTIRLFRGFDRSLLIMAMSIRPTQGWAHPQAWRIRTMGNV